MQQSHIKIAFWLALGFAVFMALIPHPPQLPGEPSDKFQHMLAFGVITALGVFAYPRFAGVRLALALIGVGAGIELVQAIPALHRDSEWMDLVADTGAILGVMLAARLVLALRRAD